MKKNLTQVAVVTVLVVITTVLLVSCANIPNTASDTADFLEGKGCTVNNYNADELKELKQKLQDEQFVILVADLEGYVYVTYGDESAEIFFTGNMNDAEELYTFYESNANGKVTYRSNDKVFFGSKTIYDMFND